MSLILDDIWFRYPAGTGDILKGVSLEIHPGESVSVVGPSGRGKSTLLGVAGLLLTPQKGQVLFDDIAHSVGGAATLLGRQISWIFQSACLLTRRTAIDNVSLPLLAAGVDRRTAGSRAVTLLEKVGIDLDEASREVRMLSGGQCQRVSVARALIQQPALLLADEPTANLDAATALRVGQIMCDAARDTMLIFATHDPAIAALADRTISIGIDDDQGGVA